MFKVLVSLLFVAAFSSHISCNILYKKEYMEPIQFNLDELNLSQNDFYDILMTISNKRVKNLDSAEEPERSFNTRSITYQYKRYKPLVYNGYTVDINVDLFRSLVSII